MLACSIGFLHVILACSAMADPPEWPYPEDIPKVEPVTVGLAGEAPADIVRYIMAAGVIEAKISPDGERVAYTSRVTGQPQLWVVDASGGASTQLTFGSGVSTFYWAPDGANLVIARDADGNERNGYYLLGVDGTKERVLLPQSQAYRQFGMFSNDGDRFLYSSTERNGRDFDIYVANLDGGEPRRLYQGEFGFFPVSWQPGGEWVLVSEARGEDANDVHVLDVSTGELVPLFQPDVAASYAGFAWLPDGSGFYMATNQDHEFAGLAFYSLKDETLSFMSTPDADVDNVTMSSDGRYLVWTTNEEGYSKLHGLDLEKGEALATPALPSGVYSVAFAESAPVLAVTISGPAIPGDVWTWSPVSQEPSHTIRSTLAGLRPETFVIPEPLRYEARDGVTLHGLLYRPIADYCEASPPVVVNVHGGPTSQSRPSFKASTQYLVNVCVAVFDVNVRGSTGFGKTYARLDNQEKRLDSVRDLVDTAEFLALDERLDADRIAVLGGSYGGYMVNAVLGEYPNVFDAGISMVGVSDWVRALQEASPFLKATDRIEYGDIREERWQEFYRQNSPINTAHRIKAPMLIQHGANDPRDPVTESDRIVRTIRNGEGTVRYMRFPDEGHSLRKQENRVAFYRAVADFLEDNL
jgi:dipeptidyl aminopeptidase/acylaminoacyl peptidase